MIEVMHGESIVDRLILIKKRQSDFMLFHDFVNYTLQNKNLCYNVTSWLKYYLQPNRLQGDSLGRVVFLWPKE